VFEKRVDFTSDSIKTDTAGTFFFDTAVEAPRFELEHKAGKMECGTGKLIKKSTYRCRL
jgi:hypothetical protein